MEITPRHIAEASGRQLARLIKVDENTVAAWTHRKQGISWRKMQEVSDLVPIVVLADGLDMRFTQAGERNKIRKEMEEFLSEKLGALKSEKSGEDVAISA